MSITPSFRMQTTVPRASYPIRGGHTQLIRRKNTNTFQKRKRVLTNLKKKAKFIKDKIPSVKDVNKIDKYSRLVFPSLFIVFNACYWCFYLLQWERQDLCAHWSCTSTRHWHSVSGLLVVVASPRTVRAPHGHVTGVHCDVSVMKRMPFQNKLQPTTQWSSDWWSNYRLLQFKLIHTLWVVTLFKSKHQVVIMVRYWIW